MATMVSPFLLLVSVLMYAVWRVWLKLRGEEFRPTRTGEWRSRTEAMREYMRTQPPMTTNQRIQTAVTISVTAVLIVVFITWVLGSRP